MSTLPLDLAILYLKEYPNKKELVTYERMAIFLKKHEITLAVFYGFKKHLEQFGCEIEY